ncbi:MAG: thiamine-phosphate kinase [Planctomycetota bacterium]
MPLDHSGENSFLSWAHALVGATAPSDVVVGPGDDCAVITACGDHWLLKVDSVLEGTHFQRCTPDQLGYATTAEVGNKAMLRTISDVAAMGGVPRFALVSLGFPAIATAAERRELMVALQDSAVAYDVAIVGGDTKSWDAERLTISVTLLGAMDGVAPVLRSGGRPGDTLYVTGALGGSILGRHKAPTPRVAAGRWLAQNDARAMIDLSDGLSIDLWRLCRASGCSARIDAVPLAAAAHELAQSTGKRAVEHALHDGEDYELLVAVRGDAPVDDRFPLFRVGELVALEGDRDNPILWWHDNGKTEPLAIGGYEHRWRP